MEEKQKIRLQLKQKRDSADPAEIRQMSEEICTVIKGQLCFLQAQAVYFYYPLGKEADLLALARQALALGKQVAFPKTDGLSMDFYRVHSLAEFSEGNYHIMEPKSTEIMDCPNPLVLVPGLAFDQKGGRLGYGKGYYDRYFARYPKCYKLGVCYRMQIVSALQSEEHDKSMDALATEWGMLHVIKNHARLIG